MSSLPDLPSARDCTHPVVDGEDDGGVDHAAQLHQDEDPADEGDPDPGGEAAAAALHRAAHLIIGNILSDRRERNVTIYIISSKDN